MPKMKTSRAAAKRFKVTGTGKLKIDIRDYILDLGKLDDDFYKKIPDMSKMIEDRLFVFTKNNEILVLIKKEDKINNVSYFEKDYLILTSMQEREEIVDVFIMKKANEIMTQNERIILVVTKSLVIYFCNLSDGLCISKRNLSNFKEDKIIHIASLCERFLLLIFERKAMLFDTFSQLGSLVALILLHRDKRHRSRK